MPVVQVELAGHPYDVRIGSGLLDDAAAHLGPQLASFGAPGGEKQRAIPVVADRNAHDLHGPRLAASLVAAGHEIAWYVVEPGETAKSWQGLKCLVDWLLSRGVTRGDHVLALGGGVVGDLTGFACAITKRGCGFVQIPTTLLAQVDSSVGGKTAINTKAGKNLVGAFHQPSLVLADTTCLATLPARQMRAGYAEVLKYGVLGGAEFFAWLEAHGRHVIAGKDPFLTQAVTRSVAAKAAIVAEDERETTGRRALLNLGHTFGHALEAETAYSDRLLHGEAVALGMVLAARYSARRAELAEADADRVVAAVEAAGLPSSLAALDLGTNGATLVDHMLNDKKAIGGTLPFVLLRSIGEAWLAKDVELKDLARFLDEQLQEG